MQIDQHTIAAAATSLDLGEGPLMVHSSLASFGKVRVGAQTVLRALLGGGRTILVPSFSWSFGVPRPDHQAALAHNGIDAGFEGPTAGLGRIYTPTCDEIDPDMGAVARELIRMDGAVRGAHPLNSFAAAGPDAEDLVGNQTRSDVYAPIRELARRGGNILLMGVGLESMTALHAAEERAGRRLFRRWANGGDGEAVDVAVGGCSRGFGAFEGVLAELERRHRVGESVWRVFPAQTAIDVATEAIEAQPELTRCDRASCVRCTDAIAGGPPALIGA